jgi:hypothetical protein
VQLTQLWQQVLFGFVGGAAAELLHWYLLYTKARGNRALLETRIVLGDDSWHDGSRSRELQLQVLQRGLECRVGMLAAFAKATARIHVIGRHWPDWSALKRTSS